MVGLKTKTLGCTYCHLSSRHPYLLCLQNPLWLLWAFKLLIIWTTSSSSSMRLIPKSGTEGFLKESPCLQKCPYIQFLLWTSASKYPWSICPLPSLRELSWAVSESKLCHLTSEWRTVETRMPLSRFSLCISMLSGHLVWNYGHVLRTAACRSTPK